jgi:hypothetical protein
LESSGRDKLEDEAGQGGTSVKSQPESREF